MNSKRQLERVNAMIQSGVTGRRQADCRRQAPGGQGNFERGYGVERPCSATVHPQMRIAREEIFGPVLLCSAGADEDATIELANSVEYGLTAAGVDQRHQARAQRRAQDPIRDGLGQRRRQPLKGTPYGGYKNSGVGRESCLEELLSYTRSRPSRFPVMLAPGYAGSEANRIIR